MGRFSRVALIGFGEVGQTLGADLLAAGADVTAFDILFARRRQRSLRLRLADSVRGREDCA